MLLLHIPHHFLKLGAPGVLAGETFVLVYNDFRLLSPFDKHLDIFPAHDNLVFHTVSLAGPFGFSAVDGDPQHAILHEITPSVVDKL